MIPQADRQINRALQLLYHKEVENYMKKSKITSIILLCALCLSLVTGTAAAGAESSPGAVLAQAVILAERETGMVLYESGADSERSPETMVKIMTLLLAAEAVEQGDVSRTELVTASESAFFDITADSETRGIAPGETMSFLDLMYCAYVGGANEACNIIAEHVAGSVDAFVAQMNTRAAELGCKNTMFVNTHGQSDSRQRTTARDLYLITREAARSPVFTEVAGAATYTVPATNMSEARSITNSNYMLSEERTRYFYKYAVFGKVSATYESGYACMEYAEQGTMSIICVVLGAEAILTEEGTIMQNLTEARRLLEWGYSSFSWQTVLSTTSLVTRVPVTFGSGADYVNLRPDSDVTVLLPNEVSDDDLKREITIYSEQSGEDLTAPVEAGQTLGELELYYKGSLVGNVKLVADSSVSLKHLTYLRQHIKQALGSRWFKVVVAIAVLLFIGYAVIIIRYNIIRARRVKEINERKERLAQNRRERED